MLVKNLYDDLPPALPDELVQVLLAAAQVRIERIVSHGHASPPDFWYDQEQGEFVLLARGAARLQLEYNEVELRPGDWLNIPPHTRHRVAWTTPSEPTIWLAVFYSGDPLKPS
jgi:cupin 2 domain-containing protein